MKHLTPGEYLGTSKNELVVGGLILSETVYQQGLASDWHSHENPYLAFVMNGGCIEKRKKETVVCAPGTMLFYNWEEPHRNEAYQQGSRIFNIEFSIAWLENMDMETQIKSGILTVTNPDHKFHLLKIFKAYQGLDNCSALEIETMIVSLLFSINCKVKKAMAVPKWATTLQEILHARWQENLSLKELSACIGIHPVTISRYFPIYFKLSIGEYIRKVRIDHALTLIRSSDQRLTDIALQCGFADQSHFIRGFKLETGLLPKHYRNF